MKQWDGIRDDLTEAGLDGLQSLIGTSFLREGELQRRSGLTSLTASGGIALGSFTSLKTGSWLILITSGGAINAVAL